MAKRGLLLVLIVLIYSVHAVEITEIMYNPSDGNEWIEFYTANELNFSGYEITDNLQTDQIVCCNGSCNYIVPQNSYFLLLDQDSTLNYSGIKFCVDDNSIGNSLGNTNDKVILTKNSVIYINTSYQKTVTSGNSITWINNSWVETSPTPGYSISAQEEPQLNNTETNETIVNETNNNEGNESTCSICTNTTVIIYVNNTCYYENLSSEINELKHFLNESKKQVKELQNESKSKNELIMLYEGTIYNLTQKLLSLNGCNFNNPACKDSESCIENSCVLKEGCEYNNPECEEGYICRENQCEKKKDVIFRTNIFNGNYYSKTGEIAVNSDSDESMECYKYEIFNMFYFARFSKKITETMEGYSIEKLPLNRIIIRDRLRNPIYKKSNYCSIPLSNEEAEGYEGREVHI